MQITYRLLSARQYATVVGIITVEGVIVVVMVGNFFTSCCGVIIENLLLCVRLCIRYTIGMVVVTLFFVFYTCANE